MSENIKLVMAGGIAREIDMNLVLSELKKKKELEAAGSYEALEKKHLGDSVLKTGIYSEDNIAAISSLFKMFEPPPTPFNPAGAVREMRMSTFAQGEDDFEDDFSGDEYKEFPEDKGFSMADFKRAVEASVKIEVEEPYDPCVEVCEGTNCFGCEYNECDCAECVIARGGRLALIPPFERPVAKEEVKSVVVDEVPKEKYFVKLFISFSEEEAVDHDEVDDLCSDLINLIDISEDDSDDLYYDNERSIEGISDTTMTEKEILEVIARYKRIISSFSVEVSKVETTPFSKFIWKA